MCLLEASISCELIIFASESCKKWVMSQREFLADGPSSRDYKKLIRQTPALMPQSFLWTQRKSSDRVQEEFLTPKLLRQLVSALICRKDICQAGLILYHCLLRFPFSVWFEGMYKIRFFSIISLFLIISLKKFFFPNKKIY